MTGYPSGLRALRPCMLNNVAFISLGVGILLSSEFSSSVIHKRTRCFRWGGKLTSSCLKRFLKLFKNRLLMDSVFVIQAHCLSLIASILFLLRLMIVERWKNLVFLSLSFSQTSLDFWRHKVSILSNHSNNLAWSASSAAPEFSEGRPCWISLMSWSREFILFWLLPNTSLFHFRRASLIEACFLYNLMNSDPATRSFHTDSITSWHWSSLSQVLQT